MSRPLHHRLAAAAIIAFLATAFAHADNRLTPQEDAADPLEKLDRIERQMTDDKNRVDTLGASKMRLVEEQRRLGSDLVHVAASAQQHERNLAEVEQRLAGLETQEAKASQALAGK